MNRATIFGVIATLGPVLGLGCGSPTVTDPGPLPQQPTYVDTPTTGSVTGYAWDPEAFIMTLETCKLAPKPPMNGTTAYCPIPALQAEGLPLYNLSIVVNSVTFMFDPTDPPPPPPGQPKYLGAPSNSTGIFTIKNLPNRDGVPFFVTSTGTGSLQTGLPPQATAGLPPVAPATYFPTVNLRPYFTGNSTTCPFGEAHHVSNVGVLEAVAKYRQAHGQATAVTDLLNPAKFAAITVFWLYAPGRVPGAGSIPNLFFQAPGLTVQPSVGTRYNIAWKPPGTGDSTQSKRGFYVDDKSTGSPLGVAVVVVPSSASVPPAITYTFVDPVTDTDAGRPFVFSPLPLPPIPGLVGSVSLQLASSAPPLDGTPSPPIPGYLCVY